MDGRAVGSLPGSEMTREAVNAILFLGRRIIKSQP